jgi:FixJ family two-component response regulator
MSSVLSEINGAGGLGGHIPGAVHAHGRLPAARARDMRVEMFSRREYGIGADSATSPAASQDTPTVFVVDDDLSVRESLELLISFEGWRPELFSSAREFLARPRPLTPSCLVLDISLPDLNGLDLQRLVADRKEMPVIFITGYGDIPVAVRAMKAGAVEFLTKPFDDLALLGAIRHAIERSQAALGQEAEIQGLRASYASLTPREQQVMALVASGLLNKQVGFSLGISEITVKAHRGRVMQKMKARSLADLVKMAAELRLASVKVLLS